MKSAEDFEKEGNRYYNQGNYVKAIECYDEAIQIRENFKEAWNSKGLALSYLGRNEEAVECYDRAIAIDENDEDAWKSKGAALWKLGRKEEAVECYDRAISIDGNDKVAWNCKGAALWKLGRNEEAIECFDRAIAIDGNYKNAWNRKGDALRDLGRNEEAIECLDRAISIDGNDKVLWHNKGISLSDLGRKEEAIECLDRAIAIDGNDEDAWKSKGDALRDLGRNEEAIECLDRAISIDGNDEVLWYNKSNSLSDLGRKEEAIECYDRAIALDENYKNAWNGKGTALIDLGRNEEAVECYDRAIAIDGNDKVLWHNKGISLSDLGRKEEAIVCFDRAIAIDGTYPDAWIKKGENLSSLYLLSEAQECFYRCIFEADRVLASNNNDSRAWRKKGEAFYHLGRYEKAIPCFEKSIDIDSTNSYAWKSKADCLRDLGQLDDALTSYDRSLSINPHFFASWDGKAVTLLRLLRLDESLECVEKAIELNPHSEASYIHKGDILFHLGRIDESLACFSRAIDLNSRCVAAWKLYFAVSRSTQPCQQHNEMRYRARDVFGAEEFARTFPDRFQSLEEYVDTILQFPDKDTCSDRHILSDCTLVAGAAFRRSVSIPLQLFFVAPNSTFFRDSRRGCLSRDYCPPHIMCHLVRFWVLGRFIALDSLSLYDFVFLLFELEYFQESMEYDRVLAHFSKRFLQRPHHMLSILHQLMIISSDEHIGENARRLATSLVSNHFRPFDPILELSADTWISTVDSFHSAENEEGSSLDCMSFLDDMKYSIHDMLDFVLNLDKLDVRDEDAVWHLVKRISFVLHGIREDRLILELSEEEITAVRKTVSIHQGNYRPLLLSNEVFQVEFSTLLDPSIELMTAQFTIETFRNALENARNLGSIHEVHSHRIQSIVSKFSLSDLFIRKERKSEYLVTVRQLRTQNFSIRCDPGEAPVHPM